MVSEMDLDLHPEMRCDFHGLKKSNDSLKVMRMYPEFEDCEYVLEDLYDYALEHGVPVVAVDNEISQAYWQHKMLYERMGRFTGFERELKLHSLNLHVLEEHALSELEKLAGK